MHLAAATESPVMVLWLVTHCPELISVVDGNGATPLHFGTASIRVVQILHSHGASLCQLDANRHSPVDKAIAGNHVPSLKWMARCAGKASCTKCGTILLHSLVMSGNVETLMSVMLTYTAGMLSWSSPNGQSPLHLAVALGNTAMVEALLATAVGPTAAVPTRTAEADEDDKSAIAWKKEEALLRGGWSKGVRFAADAADIVFSWLSMLNEDGEAPLHIAAALATDNDGLENTMHVVTMLQVLRDAGADKTLRNSRGQLILHIAVEHAIAATSKILDAIPGVLPVTLFLEYVMMFNADANACDGSGLTALQCAATVGATTVIRVLLKGCSVDARGADHTTALHCAAAGNHANAVCMLVAEGADTEARDRLGAVPLHYAAKASALESVAALIRCGADVDARNDRLETPLHVAAQNDGASTLARLLQAGGSSGSRSLIGGTVVHAALDSPACVAVLLSHGADLRARDEAGRTLAHLAAMVGRLDVIEVLAVHDICLVAKAGVDELGATPQLYASACGDVAMVAYLILSGVDSTQLASDVAIGNLCIPETIVTFLASVELLGATTRDAVIAALPEASARAVLAGAALPC